jgi:predicted DNA-binding transcriptional regulator AlpA
VSASTKPMLMLEAPRRQEMFVGLLTPAQAARSIGVSVPELDAMCVAGNGPAAFALTSRVVRYAPAEVAAWKSSRVS